MNGKDVPGLHNGHRARAPELKAIRSSQEPRFDAGPSRVRPTNPEATLTGTDGSIRLLPSVSQTNSVGLRSWLKNPPPPIRTPCRQVEVTKN